MMMVRVIDRDQGETSCPLDLCQGRNSHLGKRLRKLARQRRRSLNFLVLEAILHYLRAQESKQNAIIQN